MDLNNEYKVLKIPFASKRRISEIISENKLTKYDFEGVAYYVFDQDLNIIENKAKITFARNFANKEEADSVWSEKPSSIKRNKILSEEKDNKIIIDRFNSEIIEVFNLTVKDSFSLITGFTAKGACIGSGFNDTQILYYDKEGSQYNGWRFSTILSSGSSDPRIQLKIGNENKLFKYSKVKNNNKKKIFKFSKLDKMPEITLDSLLKYKEINRLFMIYNQDLLPENDWKEYSVDIEAVKKNNPNVYPGKKDIRYIIAGLLMDGYIHNSNEESYKEFDKKISSYRREFRKSLFSNYASDNKKYDEILNKHLIENVCEASHILDVKIIKDKIRDEIISDQSLNNKQKLRKILDALDSVSDPNNGIFLDPTTHDYFDSNLLVILPNGKIINKTSVDDYDLVKEVLLSDEQKEYLIERNKIRGI